MTISNLLATTFTCGILALTGCSSKEVVKIDQATSLTKASENNSSTTEMSTSKTSDLTAGSASDVHETNSSQVSAKQPGSIGMETDFATVYFDFDSFLLREDARKTLSHNARGMEDNPNLRVIVEGHADELGSDEYNLALGEKRALAARNYIETLGINRDRVETISYGEEKPAVTGNGDEVLAKNRRAEFVIIK